MNKNVIRIDGWVLDLEFNLIIGEEKIIRFSLFKDDMIRLFPDLVEKHRLKSKIVNGAIRKQVAWDSLIDDAIKFGILNGSQPNEYSVKLNPEWSVEMKTEAKNYM